MRISRISIGGGILVLVALIVLVALAFHEILVPLVTVAALAFLVGGGNLLYGKNSHGAKAQARTRPAQEAQNQAIDESRRQEALRQEAGRQNPPSAP